MRNESDVLYPTKVAAERRSDSGGTIYVSWSDGSSTWEEEDVLQVSDYKELITEFRKAADDVASSRCLEVDRTDLTSTWEKPDILNGDPELVKELADAISFGRKFAWFDPDRIPAAFLKGDLTSWDHEGECTRIVDTLHDAQNSRDALIRQGRAYALDNGDFNLSPDFRLHCQRQSNLEDMQRAVSLVFRAFPLPFHPRSGCIGLGAALKQFKSILPLLPLLANDGVPEVDDWLILWVSLAVLQYIPEHSHYLRSLNRSRYQTPHFKAIKALQEHRLSRRKEPCVFKFDDFDATDQRSNADRCLFYAEAAQSLLLQSADMAEVLEYLKPFTSFGSVPSSLESTTLKRRNAVLGRAKLHAGHFSEAIRVLQHQDDKEARGIRAQAAIEVAFSNIGATASKPTPQDSIAVAFFQLGSHLVGWCGLTKCGCTGESAAAFQRMTVGNTEPIYRRVGAIVGLAMSRTVDALWDVATWDDAEKAWKAVDGAAAQFAVHGLAHLAFHASMAVIQLKQGKKDIGVASLEEAQRLMAGGRSRYQYPVVGTVYLDFLGDVLQSLGHDRLREATTLRRSLPPISPPLVLLKQVGKSNTQNVSFPAVNSGSKDGRLKRRASTSFATPKALKPPHTMLARTHSDT